MAEVRRSFESPRYQNQPLYQAAYLLGGLQLRGLRRELVDSGVMTNRQFHDEIMRQGNMPMALIRLGLTRQTLTRDMDICRLSQKRSVVPKYRARRKAVSAVIARIPFTISLMRRGGTLMSFARRYWERPSGTRNSSLSTSPG